MPLGRVFQLKRPLIVFDLETTDVDPEKARILEIGMRIHRPNTDQVDSYRSFVNPECPIPKHSSNVHGITDETIATGCARCGFGTEHPIHWEHSVAADKHEWKPIPRWQDIGPNIYRGFSDADFVGYNIRYDLRVTSAEFSRIGLEFDYSKAAVIDALRVWHTLEPRTLSDAVEHFLKRKHRGAHGALTDVEETESVLLHQLLDHPKAGILELASVHSLSQQLSPRDENSIDSENKFKFDANGVAIFNFGKHKDKPMRSAPAYLTWMVDKGNFSPEVKKICREALMGRYPTKSGPLTTLSEVAEDPPL
jgi:DNA polymerase-3 subunit epsilon